MKKIGVVSVALCGVFAAYAGLFDSVTKGLQDAAKSVEKVNGTINESIQPSSETAVSAPVKDAVSLPVCEVCGKPARSQALLRCTMHRTYRKCTTCGEWISSSQCSQCQLKRQANEAQTKSMAVQPQMSSDEVARQQYRQRQQEAAAKEAKKRQQRESDEERRLKLQQANTDQSANNRPKMSSDELARQRFKEMQKESAEREAKERQQRADAEAKEYEQRRIAQEKAEQDRLAKLKAADEKRQAEEAKARAAQEAKEKQEQAEALAKERKIKEARIAAAKKDAEETRERRARIRINKAKEGSITGKENIKKRVGEIFEEELQPLFARKKRALGYTDNYGKNDFIKDCCSDGSENSWIKKARDYIPQAISFYQLGRYEDKMSAADIKAELESMGFSDAQVNRLMSQYRDWKSEGMGSDTQFLQTAAEQAPRKKTVTVKHKLTIEDKKVNNSIRDIFDQKLSWRLKAKGSSDGDIKQLREAMIEKLMEYSVDVRQQRAEYQMNEIIRMYNLNK